MTAVDEPAISPENARFRRGISPRNSSFARFFQRNEDETPSSFPPSLFFALSIPRFDRTTIAKIAKILL